MKRKFFLIFSLIFCAVFADAADKELADILSANKNILWTLRPEQCSTILGVRVRPQDRFNNVMRYSSKDNQQYVRFEKRIIPEIVFYFQKRKLQSIMISLYNRSDNGAVNEKFFNDLCSKTGRFIGNFSKDTKPDPEVRIFDKFRVESKIWQDKNCDYAVRSSKKGRYPEYLQLIIYPAGKAKKLNEVLRPAADKNQLQLNLNIDPDGSNYLNIPMINNGAKGYCLDSAVERIMKYYGCKIDSQAVAQLAESNTYQGTNLRKILNVLDKNKSRLKIRTDKILDDDILTIEDMQKLTQTYNNFAKKKKRKRLNFNDFCKGKGRYRRLNFYALIGSCEYDIFREARCKSKREVEKFAEEIHGSLSKGIPLAWLTFTFQNMRDGSPVGRFGYHMRIINGFNRKTNQIIYTDSLGKGHEKKYMSMDDARAITLMLIQITPR